MPLLFDAKIVEWRSDGSDFAASALGVYQNALEVKVNCCVCKQICSQQVQFVVSLQCSSLSMCAFFVRGCFGME